MQLSAIMAVGFSQHEETQGEAEEGAPDESNSVDAAKARTARAFSRLQKNMTLKSTLAKMVKNEAELEKESASSINNEGKEDGCGEGAESHAAGNERRVSQGDEEAGGETAEEALARTIMEEKEAQVSRLVWTMRALDTVLCCPNMSKHIVFSRHNGI